MEIDLLDIFNYNDNNNQIIVFFSLLENLTPDF